MKRLAMFAAIVACLALGLVACSSSPVASDAFDFSEQGQAVPSTNEDPTDAFTSKEEGRDTASGVATP